MIAAEQARAFLGMALCGACCGGVCDGMAALRRLARGGRAAAAVCDLLGGAVLAAGMTAAGLRLRMNPFRLYAFMGVGLGFGLWQATAGRLWRHMAARMTRFAQKAAKKVKKERNTGRKNGE